MTTNNFFSEADAVKLAGVSPRTLLRFQEAGYLTVHTNADGTRGYQRAQIEEIFSVASAPIGHECTPAVETNPDSTEDLEITEIDDKSDASQKYQAAPAGSTISEQPVFTSDEPLSDAVELQRLRNLLEMQERILDAKDNEISDLKNQRAWLRERIEKLEEKSDRDQILLLSETQTIRSLIAYQEERRSSSKLSVKNLLAWLGLAPSSDLTTIPQNNDFGQKQTTPSSSRTIDVPRTAN